MLTEDAISTTTNTGFATFARLSARVPAGATHCLLVEFNAETACHGTSGLFNDFCYVRALANGVEMLPLTGGFLSFQSEDDTAEANQTRFIRRVSGGSSGITYTVDLQRRSSSGTTQFFLDDWMFSLTRLF